MFTNTNMWEALVLLFCSFMVLTVCVSGQCNSGYVTTLASSTLCPNPWSIHQNTANGLLFAACGSGDIISINGSIVTIKTNSIQCPNPRNVFVNSNTGVIYA